MASGASPAQPNPRRENAGWKKNNLQKDFYTDLSTASDLLRFHRARGGEITDDVEVVPIKLRRTSRSAEALRQQRPTEVAHRCCDAG